MNRRFLYMALLLSSMSASAQTVRRVYDSQIMVSQHQFAQKGDSLIVEMDIDLSRLNVPSTRELELIPALKADSLGKLFPSILIRGKHKQREAKRMYSLMNRKEKEQMEPYYAVRGVNGTKLATVHYRVSAPFEDWMAKSQLIIIEDMCGCAGARQQVGAELLTDQLLLEKRFEISPWVAYITPEAETVKSRAEQGQSFLDFQVGKSAILPDFRNNPRELTKIRKMIDFIRSDKDFTITDITITGNASPDGKQVSNEKLSEDRARSLVDYLKASYDFKDNVYHYVGAGEDWKTLRVLVDSSSISNKEAILSLIDGSAPLDTKEMKMRAVNGGKPFNEIKTNFYPLLRRTDFKIDYTIRGFSPEEGREVIKTKPGQLSLNEMFLVANTYEKGSEAFNEVFDIAARVYPDSQIANLNAAAASIERNELATARKHIAKAGELPASYNNLGVLEMMEGNWEAAERALTKAKDLGCKEAEHNLEQLNLKIENNKLFEGISKQSVK